MIVLSNLYTGYDKSKPLLKDFNYNFKNQIYGILGESGCGKTTLLRTIAGLTKPLSGDVYIDAKRITKPSGNGVFMMHQNYTSFDWLTCIDNILLPKRLVGRITDEDRQNAIKMLECVGLEDHRDKYPKQLSGGMRQRLALARTIFMQPDIILMDEPLSALDATTRAEMQKLILKLHKDTGNTIIMITHSTEEADNMCAKIIKL